MIKASVSFFGSTRRELCIIELKMIIKILLYLSIAKIEIYKIMIKKHNEQLIYIEIWKNDHKRLSLMKKGFNFFPPI